MSGINMMHKRLVFFVLAMMAAFLISYACLENDGTGVFDGDAESDIETDTPENVEDEADTETDAEVEGEAVEIEQDQGPALPFRVAVISDTHLLPDPDSMPGRNFTAFAQLIDTMDPVPAYVINTGDCIEDMFCIPDVNCEDPPAVLKTYRSLIEENYNVPFRFALGNHDDRFLDLYGGNEIPLAMWSKAFEGSELYPGPYHYFDHSGFRFIILFGSDTAIDHETNDQAGFGTEQLAWLDGLLADGLPSLLFWHQMIDPVAEMQKEEPNAILDVIAAHSENVKAVFAGHGHSFARIEWQGVVFYETDSLRDEEGVLPHHLLECDPATGSVSVINADEIVYEEGI